MIQPDIFPQEALDTWRPAAPVIKKELLLPTMLGLDSWGRQRRLHGDQRSLAQTVNTVRSELSLANLNPLQTVILQEHSDDKNDHF